MSESKSSKMLIMEKENPDSRVEFQYNPSEYNDSVAANYGNESIEGTAMNRPVFEGGEARSIKLNMRLNAYGDPDPVNIESIIRWLQDRTRPTSLIDADSDEGDSPPIMEVVGVPGSWDFDVFTCVIDNVDVDRTVFAKQTFEALRAEISISLTEYVSTEMIDKRKGRLEKPEKLNEPPEGTGFSEGFAHEYNKERKERERQGVE